MSASEQFLQAFQASVANNTFVKIVLAKPRVAKSDLKNVYVKPVILQQAQKFSFVYRRQTNDVTKNFDTGGATAEITDLLSGSFDNAELFTEQAIFYFQRFGSGKEKFHQKKQSNEPATGLHDHVKSSLIDESAAWLRETGISSAAGVPLKNMQHKLRQINRYVELIVPLLKGMDTKAPLRIADLGSGKGYLTFALYGVLIERFPMLEMTGVELRKSLVDKSNGTAQRSGFTSLKFAEGSIEQFDSAGYDMLIALHACDTATDDVIAAGIKANVPVIVCAPCCHKQVRKAMKTEGILKEITKHGILAERTAEMLTDAMRALVLEAYGYQTQVMDFIDIEHTPKNVMITAVRKSRVINPNHDKLQKVYDLMKLYSISDFALLHSLGVS